MIPTRPRNCLVSIQTKTTTPGQWNGTEGWAENRKAWVSINPNRGREIFRDDERESVVTHTIRGDFLELDGIGADWRILYNPTHDYDPHGIPLDTMVFEIRAIMPDLDHRADIMIQCELESRRLGDL